MLRVSALGEVENREEIHDGAHHGDAIKTAQ